VDGLAGVCGHGLVPVLPAPTPAGTELARGGPGVDHGDLARRVRAPRAVRVVARGLDDTYGPLTAITALLLWANVTGIALLAGVPSQPRSRRCGPGARDPLIPDSDDDGIPNGQAHARLR
jgi:hypothetical protein